MNFASQLLNWFHQSGRKHLPWQEQINPYRVWISEIMLQQTQVSTVIPYYQRFMACFPNIEHLAAAPLNEVLALWAGLGYYARARNLHKTAKLIVTNFNACFPEDVEIVKQLPGIGPSTAHAILAISFGQKLAILDGNVKRVLARYYGVMDYPGLAKVEKKLWGQAEVLLPAKQEDIAAYTQAIMDLGALICTRTQPSCSLCPIQKDCYALQHNCTDQLPKAKPKRAYPLRVEVCLLLAYQTPEDCFILLEQRPEKGIWGGLYAPLFFHDYEALAAFMAHTHLDLHSAQKLSLQKHKFTHFELHFTPYLLHCSPQKLKNLKLTAFSLQEIETKALPTPIKNLLAYLKRH